MKSSSKPIVLIGLLVLGVMAAWFIFFKPSTPTEPAPAPQPTIAPPTSESPNLINTVWTATSVTANPIVAGTVITVQFTDQGRLTGSDGCNTFATNYTLNGTTLTIDPAMISTKKACDEAVMNQADTFTQALLATTSYTLGDGLMVLNQGNVPGLEFTGQTNSLSKTSWDVTGYNNGKQAVVSPITGTNLTITFGDDGTISGNSGCNTYSGQYTLSGQSITISPLASTMRACIEPEGVAEQETAFLASLQQATVWNLQGNQMSLRNAQDALAVTAISPPVNPNP
jgi:heat shock protein HslJ